MIENVGEVRRRILVLAIALGVSAAACSSTSDSSAADSTTSVATSSASTTTTEALPSTTEAPERPVASYTLMSNLVYMTLDGVDMKLDVYAPTSDGPSPVVVSFHGDDSSGKGAQDTVAVAREAAAQGMVVFVPTWLPSNPGALSAEGFQTGGDIANCAVAFAQQNAAEFGGDSSTTVLDSFSAGVFPAMLATLEPALASVPGCATDAVPAPVAVVVLGDGEYFLYSSRHDGAFEADPAGMQAELARLLVAASWPQDLDTEFFLWVAGNGTNPRAIEGLDDESGWFALRDPDGSIRADLERLDQLEDGFLTYIDAGQLLDLRLSEGDVTVTLDEYPGSHTTLDKAAEIVDYFKTAVAR